MKLESRVVFALTLLVVVAGGWVRLYNLGERQLTFSELPYHFAAAERSQLQTSTPDVPASDAARGRPMIHAIAVAQNFIFTPETAARLPAAVIGTLTIPLFAAAVWMIGGPWAALVATFFFAFYPEAVQQSRTAGLYSTQQFVGIIALFAGWLATSRAGPRQSSAPADLVRRWIWSAIAVGALLAGALAHLSMGTVAAAFAIWVLLLAAAAIWISGISTLRNNLAVQLVIVGILATLVVYLIRQDLFTAIHEKISAVPNLPAVTASAEARSPWYYIFGLASQFGWLLPLFPLLILVSVRSNTWLTVYLSLWFLVPTLAHSLFIARKEERLILVAVPALFVLAGLAAHECRRWMIESIKTHAREWFATYRSVVNVANVIAWVTIFFTMLSVPAFVMALRTPTLASTAATSEWAALKSVFGQDPYRDSMPLGSIDALLSTLYVGRGDFSIGSTAAVVHQPLLPTLPPPRFPAAVANIQRDDRTGAAIAPTLTHLRNAYQSFGEVFIAIDSRNIDTALVDESLRNALLSQATELCLGRCGSLRLFRLRLAG